MRPLFAIGALALCGCGPSAAAERPLLQPRLGEGAPRAEHGLTLRCDDAVDSLDTLPPSYAELLGAVALASDHPAPSPSDGMLFAKSGLVVRAGHASTLEAAEGSSLRIAWGHGAKPARRVNVPSCPSSRRWLAFVGGFWVDTPECAPLVVRSVDREARLGIGVGVPCSE